MVTKTEAEEVTREAAEEVDEEGVEAAAGTEAVAEAAVEMLAATEEDSDDEDDKGAVSVAMTELPVGDPVVDEDDGESDVVTQAALAGPADEVVETDGPSIGEFMETVLAGSATSTRKSLAAVSDFVNAEQGIQHNTKWVCGRTNISALLSIFQREQRRLLLSLQQRSLHFLRDNGGNPRCRGGRT